MKKGIEERMRLFGLAFSGLIIIFSFVTCSFIQSRQIKPNIILINADDLGAHHVGVYGQEIIKTPRLDQMASEGALFKNGYSSATTCGPSRVALLLGKHVGHLPWSQRKNGGLCRVYKNQIAFPELLQAEGYETVMFGKHHNVAQTADYTPIGDLPSDCGFDLSIGTFWAMAAHQFYLDGVTAPQQNYRRHLWKDERGTITPYQIDSKRYTHNEYVDLALNYISENKKKPFFLYLLVQIPHWEIAVPQQGDVDYQEDDYGLLEQYQNEDGSSIFSDAPYKGQALFQRPVQQPAAMHAGMISRLDRDMGKILDLLKKEGLDKNTIVIFTSDNGKIGTPGGDHFKMNKMIRGSKGALYEGGLKVPFIMWGGGVHKQTIEDPIIMHDLPATILELAEVDSTFDSDGISWKNRILGSDNNNLGQFERDLYWENYHGHGCQSVLMDNRYKVIKSNCGKQDYKLQLYDLVGDPLESNDLSANSELEHLLVRAKKVFKNEHLPFQGSGIVF